MSLTAYDRRQLRKALSDLKRARIYIEWVLGGDPDAALRCCHAANLANNAQIELRQTDRRLSRRSKEASPADPAPNERGPKSATASSSSSHPSS